MGKPLIVTKYLIPGRRADLLRRPRLVDFLHEHVDRKLVMVCAPAGYGKTSLLTEYAHEAGLPLCWYALDPVDCDLRVFVEYLLASIRHRFALFGSRTLDLLESMTNLQDTEALVGVLVNEIYEEIPDFFAVVLDDYHHVNTSEAVNRFLDALLQRLPENCHLIVASRTIPTLTPRGLAMLTALVAYSAYVAWLARATRSYLPRTITGTLVVSLALAVVGGVHGAWLSLNPPGPPGASGAAHGALAVGTLLLLPALTLADALLVDAAGGGLTARLASAGLGFLGAGIVLAYLARLGLGGPAASLAASGLQLAGFVTFALHTYQATAPYRRAVCARLRFLQPVDARPSTLALLELERSQVLLIELLAALAGFPGFGWLFAGHTLVAALLLYIGPGVAWALIPSLLALSGGWLQRVSWNLLLIYLPASALASTLLLRSTLRGREAEGVQTTANTRQDE